jgi:hypothetical protein
MSEDRGDSRTPFGSAHTGAKWRRLLVPGLTLLLGVLLGMAGTLAARSSPDAQPRPPDESPATRITPTAAPSGRTLTIPASCEQGLDSAETAMKTLGEAVLALRELESARLQTLLNQLQQAERDVDALAAQCRREARRATLPPRSAPATS